jgi:hypothetical protein
MATIVENNPKVAAIHEAHRAGKTEEAASLEQEWLDDIHERISTAETDIEEIREPTKTMTSTQRYEEMKRLYRLAKDLMLEMREMKRGWREVHKAKKMK